MGRPSNGAANVGAELGNGAAAKGDAAQGNVATLRQGDVLEGGPGAERPVDARGRPTRSDGRAGGVGFDRQGAKPGGDHGSFGPGGEHLGARPGGDRRVSQSQAHKQMPDARSVSPQSVSRGSAPDGRPPSRDRPPTAISRQTLQSTARDSEQAPTRKGVKNAQVRDAAVQRQGPLSRTPSSRQALEPSLSGSAAHTGGGRRNSAQQRLLFDYAPTDAQPP